MQRSAETSPFEDLPFDFTAHLERRLCVDHETASATLADWVGSYEPARPEPMRTPASARTAARAA